MTTTLPSVPTRTPRVFEIDPRIGAVATKAPKASNEDSRPQAIVKLHCLNSLHYIVHHRLPVFTNVIKQ